MAIILGLVAILFRKRYVYTNAYQPCLFRLLQHWLPEPWLVPRVMHAARNEEPALAIQDQRPRIIAHIQGVCGSGEQHHHQQPDCHLFLVVALCSCSVGVVRGPNGADGTHPQELTLLVPISTKPNHGDAPRPQLRPRDLEARRLRPELTIT